MSSKIRVKLKQSNSARSKNYRERMQSEEWREEQRVRSMQYRKAMTQEQRERYQEKSRERSRRFRLRKKAASLAALDSKQSKPKRETRSTTQKAADKREYHKMKQREYRARMNPTKKRWARIKDRDRKRVKAVQHTQKLTRAERQQRRDKQKDPESFAEHVESLIESATPKKRAKLESRHIMRKKLRTEMAKTATLISSSVDGKKAVVQAIKANKARVKKPLAKIFGVSCSALYHKKKGYSGRKVTSTVKQAVHNFYKDIDVSTEVPRKRRTTKPDVPLYILQKSVTETFVAFRKKHADINIGVVSFARLRPANVKLARTMKWVQCSCELCTNMEALLKSIRVCMFRDNVEVPEFMRSASSLVEATLCSMDLFNEKCIDRLCSECGMKSIKEACTQWVASTPCAAICCRQWQHCPTLVKGREVKRLKPVLCSYSKKEATQTLLNLLEPYGRHCFVARWQQKAFKRALDDLQDDEVLAVVDFPENYIAQRQNEAQTAYYSRNQITIHPIVCWYWKGGIKVRDSIILISNDLKHDAAAVACFIKLAITHLSTEKPGFSNLTVFSDGAASQYKSKGPMQNIVRKFDCPTITVNWHFFGSRHGKGPSDGESGVVKSKASRLVLSGEYVIDDYIDLYQATSKELTVLEGLSQRHVYCVPSEDVEKERANMALREVSTVPGIRKWHHVQSYAITELRVWPVSCGCGSTPCIRRVPDGKRKRVLLGEQHG